MEAVGIAQKEALEWDYWLSGPLSSCSVGFAVITCFPLAGCCWSGLGRDDPRSIFHSSDYLHHSSCNAVRYASRSLRKFLGTRQQSPPLPLPFLHAKNQEELHEEIPISVESHCSLSHIRSFSRFGNPLIYVTLWSYLNTDVWLPTNPPVPDN